MFGEDDELEELREIHDFQFSQSNGVVKRSTLSTLPNSMLKPHFDTGLFCRTRQESCSQPLSTHESRSPFLHNPEESE